MSKQRKAKYNPNDVIEILWIDSHHRSGWLDPDDVQEFINSKDDFNMYTVGYFVEENESFIYVIQSRDSQEVVHRDAIMAIPKVSILKINLLKKG